MRSKPICRERHSFLIHLAAYEHSAAKHSGVYTVGIRARSVLSFGDHVPIRVGLPDRVSLRLDW